MLTKLMLWTTPMFVYSLMLEFLVNRHPAGDRDKLLNDLADAFEAITKVPR